MGITSVGHRLTILKSVYDIKIKQDIPIESDHYVPLCEHTLKERHSLNCANTPSSGRCRGSICHRNTQRHSTPRGTVASAG